MAVQRQNVTSVQVLVAAVNRDANDLPNRLNLQTDAIICNQCNRYDSRRIIRGDCEIRWFDFDERGVGLNRNNALMRATADVLLLSDDDMRFMDGYAQTALRVFNEYQDADIIIFNLEEKQSTRRRTTSAHYVRTSGYGAARFALRRESVRKSGVAFNLNFGGGCRYSYGEDSLFLADCRKKGLKILAVPEIIAELTDERESTWFKGRNEKYYFDKGVLWAAMGVSLPHVRCANAALKAMRKGDMDFKRAYGLIMNGIREYKTI